MQNQHFSKVKNIFFLERKTSGSIHVHLNLNNLDRKGTKMRKQQLLLEQDCYVKSVTYYERSSSQTGTYDEVSGE